MRSVGSSIVRNVRIVRSAFLVVVAGLIFSGSVAYAADTTVQVIVTGNQAPVLQSTNVTSPVTTTTMPLTTNWVINALTQVQVYIDGNYSATVPLTPSATSFSYGLTLNSGTHTVTFVGISAYTSTNPSVTFTITFTPPVAPSSSGNASSTPLAAPRSGGVFIGGQSLPSLAVPALFELPVLNSLYKALVFLDIVNPSSPDGTPAMLWRFVLLVFSFFLLLFARPVLSLYRIVRYRWLGWDKRPLPELFRRRPLFWIRALGIVVILLVFILL